MEGLLKTIVGAKPGPSVVILAAIHGNETCGIRAFEKLLPTLTIEVGTVHCVIGNPKAVEQNARFTEANLNRLFQNDNALSEVEKNSYEYQRSRELLPLLKEADVILDIHSTATPGGPAFIICESKSFGLASKLPFSRLCYNWGTHQPGGTEYFADKYGKIGICIECGHHDSPTSTQLAIDSIISLLVALDCQPKSNLTINSTEPFTQTKIKISQQYKTQTNFTPARTFTDFESVKQGEKLGVDGATEVPAQESGIVIFVRKRTNSGEEAFLLGTPH